MVDYLRIQQIVQQTDSIRVQSYLQDSLFHLCPHIQFMGEEKDNNEIDFDKDLWILDPVDGTTNLIQNCSFSAVSLGLWNGKKKKIVLGIIYQPFTKELFFASDGQGAFLNGSPIHVSSKNAFSSCVISAGTTPYYKEFADEVFDASKRVFLNCSDIRRTGSAALDMAYVACGRLDGYFDKILSPWDYAAGYLIIKEAGGFTSDYSGELPSFTHKSSICCSNALIHTQLLSLVQP